MVWFSDGTQTSLRYALEWNVCLHMLQHTSNSDKINRIHLLSGLRAYCRGRITLTFPSTFFWNSLSHLFCLPLARDCSNAQVPAEEQELPNDENSFKKKAPLYLPRTISNLTIDLIAVIARVLLFCCLGLFLQQWTTWINYDCGANRFGWWPVSIKLFNCQKRVNQMLD